MMPWADANPVEFYAVAVPTFLAALAVVTWCVERWVERKDR